ncbi:MAG: hypothetical protein BWY72_00986 [Bacteroidetes bacterium ADurb.Bin416]|nr:MAG: hypothetical protein BWY72_00986 [Bacteroidetes bacterium ADurb.Bin416]
MQQYELVSMGGSDGAAVGDVLTVGGNKGRGCHGDAFQLTKEIGRMRRLVITDGLPYHGLSVSVVMPKGRNAIGRGVVGCVDAHACAIANEDFFAPVTEYVATHTGVVL